MRLPYLFLRISGIVVTSPAEVCRSKDAELTDYRFDVAICIDVLCRHRARKIAERWVNGSIFSGLTGRDVDDMAIPAMVLGIVAGEIIVSSEAIGRSLLDHLEEFGIIKYLVKESKTVDVIPHCLLVGEVFLGDRAPHYEDIEAGPQ